tara:strand:- start:413 stop:607 length:195 start_codon:yes stop_codon:yes gene_type:complete
MTTNNTETIFSISTQDNGEIEVYINNKLVAQMMDLRDCGMGIAPHKLFGISELEAVAIIRHLEK